MLALARGERLETGETDPARADDLPDLGSAQDFPLVVAGIGVARSCAQRVIDEGLVPYLHDRRDAWELDGDGRYRRVAEDGLSAQQALMERYAS